MDSASRWRQIDALYHAARERAPEARAAFLAGACGNDEDLRREVESLLAQPVSVDGVLDGRAPAVVPPLTSPTDSASFVGRRLGVYQVLTLIGAGGMGDVYRARDTRLGRDVALKVLPREFTADAERLARFDREARLLAALNHPHIAAIHGVEDLAPASSTGPPTAVRALVLELVEGETLAERIRRSGRKGPAGLSVGETLTIARQIADALDAAHEKGIVHRDLKPANITITPDGAVKVLDFGIAKLAPALGPDQPSPTALPTITAERTREGLIVGTAAYMSPEQARGQAVDKRTDIWAFGCVLYEMLTGRAVFARDTISDTLAAVLEREPDWGALPPTTPPGVRRLLEHCLAKDLRHRLRDIGDVRIELDDAALARGSGAQTADRPRNVRTALAGAAVVAAASLAIAVWALTRPAAETARETVRYAIEPQPGEHFPIEAGMPVSMAISPDGHVAFTARQADGTRIYLRRSDSFESTPIAGTDGAIGPFFSPDGRMLAFASGGYLRKVPVTGGPPQTIAETPNVHGGSWSTADTIVFSRWSSGLFKVSAHGGKPEPLTTLDEQSLEIQHRAPHVLPGAAFALFTVDSRGRASRIEAVDIATGRRQSLVEGTNPYVSNGHLVFARGGALFAAPFDSGRIALTGTALRLGDSVRIAEARAHFAVGAGGTLAYLPATENLQRLVWVDRTGLSRPAVDEQRAFSHPRISPDGNRILVQVPAQSGGPNELWIYDITRGTRTRLSATGGRPIWTPDGKRITFQRDGRLYAAPVDDSTPPEILLVRDASTDAVFPLAWSRDGRFLVYSRVTRATNRDVFILPVDGAPNPFLATPRDERAAMFSPDGRWIVYAALEPGREEEVYLQPYGRNGERIVLSRGGGIEPVWSPAGTEIFYRSTDGRSLMVVEVQTDPIHVGTPRRLFQGAFPIVSGATSLGSFWSNYDVAPGGGRFLMVEAAEQPGVRLNVVVHWLDDVRRRQRPDSAAQ